MSAISTDRLSVWVQLILEVSFCQSTDKKKFEMLLLCCEDVLTVV